MGGTNKGAVGTKKSQFSPKKERELAGMIYREERRLRSL